MRKLIVLTVVGLFSMSSFAAIPAPAESLANPSNPAPMPVPNPSDPSNKETIKYSCRFEERNHDQDDRHRDDKKQDDKKQDDRKHRDLKCKVKGLLCHELSAMGGSKRCHDREDPIEIKCNNGYELQAKDSAVTIEDHTLWINADKHGKIATLRVKEKHIELTSDDDHERKLKADLLISNKITAHLEGKCRFEKEDNGHGHGLD